MTINSLINKIFNFNLNSKLINFIRQIQRPKVYFQQKGIKIK